MAQVSYGTITITDTNDIERIYMEYAQSSSNSTAPTTGWSENIPAWEQGKYIWQRTVVKKEGVPLSGDSYGDPVCLTGSTGSTGSPGATGRGVSSIVTSYCNYGTGTPAANYSGWGSTVPTYDSTKPNYWVKTVITYTSGTPATDTKIYQDNGITSATATAASAKTQAAAAEGKADTAVSTANTANTNASSALNLANGINQHFWWIAEDTSTTGGTIPAGAYITDIAQSTFKSNPGNYGNLLLRSDGVYLNLGLQTLASFKSNALTFYNSAGAELGKFGSDGLEMSGTLNIKGGGRIGQDSTNYWQFGDNVGYNVSTAAYLIGKGNSSIQLGENGHWRIDKNRIHTGWYVIGDSSSSTPAGSLHFDTYNVDRTSTSSGDQYYWDYGLHFPISNATPSNNKFLYIRYSKGTVATTTLSQMKDRIDNDNYWNYQFYVDDLGNVHAPGFYIGDSTIPIGGGAGTVAERLTQGYGSATQPVYFNSNGVPTNTTYQLNAAGAKGVDTSISAASTSTNLPTSQAVASFVEGKGYITSYTDNKVQTSQANTTKIFLAGTSTAGTSTGTLNFDSNVYLTTTAGTLHATTFEGNLSGTASRATADGDGNTIKTTYLKLSGGNVTGAVTFGSSVSIDKLTAGDLVVDGSASFTNNLQANTINGVAVGSSPKFTDNNTTYTFANGTNGFTVTPSGGTAQTVTVTPSIANNVTGLGTSGYLVKFTGGNTIGNGPALGTDATKFLNNKGEWVVPAGTGVTSVAASGSGGITISGSPITTSGTIAIGLNLSTAINGLGEGTSNATRDDYAVVQYAGGGTTTTSYHRRKLSNVFAALNSSDITTALGYTPYNATNPNGYTSNTGTVTSVATSSPITGGTITGSGTIGHATSGVGNAVTTAGLYKFKYDTYGHVTGVTSVAKADITGLGIPGSDTHHTAYLYATTSDGVANVITATNDPYLTLVENGTARSRVQLKAGTNVTSISANAGVITFNVKDTTYTAATAAPGKVASTSAQGSSTNYARQDHTHGIDLATGDSNGQVKIAGTNISVKGLGSWAYKSSGSASDVGLGNVTNYAQITKIGESGDGKLRVWTGDPDGTGYTDVEVHITAYDQSTVSKAEALNLSAKVGDTNKPVYFKADGKPYAISYEINKSVPADAVFIDTTYNFADSYNASTNKGATVATVTNAINNLDVTAITGTTGQTITSISETNGKISATYSNISITKSQISDFPSSMTPAAHNHSQIVTVGDQRSTATTPNDYANALIFKGLKNKTTIGSPSDDTYSYLIGLRGWSDSSGGHSHEIAFNNTGIFVRQESASTANTWGSWYRIYTTGNKPTKSDVGLSNVANSDTTNASNITSGTLAKERLATSGATAGSYGDSENQTPGYGSTFKVPYITVDTYGRVTSISEHTVKIPASDNSNTWRAIQVDGTDILSTGTNTNKLNLKAGTNVSLSNSSGTVTITATDVKVTQTNTTGNADYRLLFSENANDTDSTETARKNINLKFNPSSGLLKTYGISSAAGSTPVIYSDVSAAEIKAADSSLTTNSSDSDWLKALLVALCTKYPNRSGCIFKGTMSPNSTGWYEVHIYGTSTKDSTTGLPQYSFGRFLKYINNYSLFGTASYTYSYRTVDTNTWNPLTTSQAGYVSTAPNDTTKFLRGDATWAQVSSADLSNIRLTWSGSVSTTDWILAHDTAATGTPLFRAMTPANLKTTMPLNNVENTKLSTWAGSSNITTVGTISSGTWNGSAIPVANGGTGATTAANARTNLGLGSAATASTTTSIASGGTGLPTAGTVYTYVTNAISGASNTYVTIATDQTITANQKTFNGAIRWGNASKYGAVHYDSTLDALVFNFA